jgi:leucyl aminopeptidase
MVFKSCAESGLNTHERVVLFPLWEEYREMLKSDVADIKNIGGKEAGAITAGKFLEHFTSFPWIHLDIAGPAFIHAADAYRTIGGTAPESGFCLIFFTVSPAGYISKNSRLTSCHQRFHCS